MKKIPVIIFATLMALLMISGAILKIQHKPGGSVLMTIAMLSIIAGLAFQLVKQKSSKRPL
jgi:hypothetical protein